MAKKSERHGPEAFHNQYEDWFGERWEKLQTSLIDLKQYVAVPNPFCELGPLGEVNAWGCWDFQKTWELAPLDQNGRPQYYLMDLGSAIIASSLQVEPGQKVLDMCAAPGGKSLILAFALKETGELTVNDRSRERRARLKRNLEQFLPEAIFEKIHISGHDASRWSLHEKEIYDRILLDAPCSSERHVLEKPEQLKEWSLGRTKRLAMNQGAMIIAAFDALKPGGRMVYSTCALSPLENDQVVAKLLKKRGDQVQLHKEKIQQTEKTEYGFQLLPDQNGWGPLYFSSIGKRLAGSAGQP